MNQVSLEDDHIGVEVLDSIQKCRYVPNLGDHVNPVAVSEKTGNALTNQYFIINNEHPYHVHYIPPQNDTSIALNRAPQPTTPMKSEDNERPCIMQKRATSGVLT
jgi:hypothetical protein